MKLSEWAHVAEITSAIAVVISLIYIGLEVSQNTVAVKANTHQSMIDYGREQSEILLTNETLADLVEKGESNPAALTARERSQFYEFTTWRLATWESVFMNYEHGLVDEKVWRGWDGYYRLLTLDKPGYAEFWRDNRIAYYAPFMEYVDSLTMK
jgi:hypothetical protein